MTSFELKDITKIFPGNVVAVDNINVDIASGEFMVLLGPSGCGKSTILRILAGLEMPDAGEVIMDGQIATSLSPRERGVAMVFQNFALYPYMTVRENISFPLRLSGHSVAESHAKSEEMATMMGIGNLMDRLPQQLSGGQRQRVAMGRALVRRPEIFLMDEPLSNLDVGLRAELRSEIKSLVSGLGVTTVYVTHDQSEAMTMAHRIAVVSRGSIQDIGTAKQIYDQPATTYVAAFLGTPRMSLLEARVDVQLDQYVALQLGPQEIRLPWNEIQSRTVARYHGEYITVGVRAESLRLSAEDPRFHLLRGTVHSTEHHGHETLVNVHIGAKAVVLEGLRDSPPPQPGGGRRRGLAGLLRRL
ncbi:MAG TPA: ABC transporter ATP-binding protein, partial [Stackebrandtia sp.]|uniref:ABC transporter ATP-binding protein n=1 Tax=Stackebrandtia sp. TaxID=2023065 RepID=UPI002D65638D